MSGFLFMDLQSPMYTAGLNNKYSQRNHLDKRAEIMGRKILAQSKKNSNGARSCPGQGELECKQRSEECGQNVRRGFCSGQGWPGRPLGP